MFLYITQLPVMGTWLHRGLGQLGNAGGEMDTDLTNKADPEKSAVSNTLLPACKQFQMMRSPGKRERKT